MLVLEDLVRGCDRRIQKNKQRSEMDVALTEQDLSKLSQMQNQIAELSAKCIEAEAYDDIDTAQAYMCKMEAMKDQLENLSVPQSGVVKHNYVCEVSGNFLSTKDNEERMRTHFEGN